MEISFRILFFRHVLPRFTNNTSYTNFNNVFGIPAEFSEFPIKINIP